MRVVAPTSVNRSSFISIVCAPMPGAEDDVEAEVLHRRVERLLDRRREPVDLVDEEDVARARAR